MPNLLRLPRGVIDVERMSEHSASVVVQGFPSDHQVDCRIANGLAARVIKQQVLD